MGVCYEGLRLEKKATALTLVFFLARRFLLAILLALDEPMIAINGIIAIQTFTLFQSLFLRPYKSILDNISFVFNEAFLSLFLLTLFIFNSAFLKSAFTLLIPVNLAVIGILSLLQNVIGAVRCLRSKKRTEVTAKGVSFSTSVRQLKDNSRVD